MDEFHKPVLLQPALHFLNVKTGLRYVDATLGSGGHALEIIVRGGRVLGIDQDPDAIAACPRLDNLVIIQDNFIHLTEILKENDWNPVAGIILDVGVSWHQLNTPGRGFSFQTDGPLDMRMDPSLPNTAATLVNSLQLKQLAQLLADYGQVSEPMRWASRIVSGRPYTTTLQLARVLGNSPHIKRQVFQSLRIAVNDELTALTSVLSQSIDVLDHRGRLVVLTFHSLEDQIVKLAFRSWTALGLGQTLTPKPVVPDSVEIESNPHSQSAKLRAYEKI